MRYVLLLTIILFLGVLQEKCFSQVRLGVKSGTNISSIKGLWSNPDYRWSWYGGVAGEIQIKSKSSIRVDMLYSSEGGGLLYLGGSADFGGIPKSRIRFNWIKMPLLFSYQIDTKMRILLGPELGYLLNIKEKITTSSDGNVVTSYRNREKDYPRKWNVAIDLGGEYFLLPKFGIELRYSYGFKMIRDVSYTNAEGSPSHFDGRQRTFQMGLIYLIR